MAYMNQEKKKDIDAALKAVMPRGWKYTLAVRHHSTIVCSIKSAPVDLLALNEGRTDVNTFYADRRFDGIVLTQIKNIIAALNLNNHDRSDSMVDHFDVGHYVNLRLGTYDVPFACTAPVFPETPRLAIGQIITLRHASELGDRPVRVYHCDERGRFYAQIVDAPDSSGFIVTQADVLEVTGQHHDVAALEADSARSNRASAL